MCYIIKLSLLCITCQPPTPVKQCGSADLTHLLHPQSHTALAELPCLDYRSACPGTSRKKSGAVRFEKTRPESLPEGQPGLFGGFRYSPDYPATDSCLTNYFINDTAPKNTLQSVDTASPWQRPKKVLQVPQCCAVYYRK